jgi:hypothetical protein
MIPSVTAFAAALTARSVRAVLIGVYGANLYAPAGQAFVVTRDADFFLPPDPDNLLHAWAACDDCGLTCFIGPDPLDRPRDRWLAERVVDNRAPTRATGAADGDIDLIMVMAGFDFETIWNARRMFIVDGAEIAVARLEHIVTSKHAAGREKDRLFLATHRDALEQLLKRRS